MKKLIILIGIIALASCDMNSPEMIRQQITKKKDKIRELNQQVQELEGLMGADSLNSESKFNVPVTLKELKLESFNHFIELNGKLEAEENAFISPELNGQIKKIHIREGDRVKKGQLLVSLNTSLTESSIKEVLTGLELATKLHEKQKGLWEKKIGSELRYLEAKNAKEQAEARLATLNVQLNMAKIRAPFNGEVEIIFLKEGEMAAPGMQVLQLVSLKSLKIYADLSEKYLGSIKQDEIVQIDFQEKEDLNMTVPIHRIGNVIDEKSRTFRIELKVPNLKEELKPNMFTTIRVNDFNSDQALVVPSLIIKQDISGKYVYLAKEGSGVLTASKKYIEEGLSYQDQTMIISGLDEGDRIIVEGYSLVSDGVEIALR